MKQKKKQALYNGILREASKFQGDAAKAANTLEGTLKRLADSYQDVQIAIGKFATENSIAVGFIKATGDVLKILAESIDFLREQFSKLGSVLDKINLFFLGLVKNIETFLDIISGTDFFSNLSNGGADYDALLKNIKDSQDKLNKQLQKSAVSASEFGSEFTERSRKGW